MAGTQQQDGWIRRVLQVELGPAAPADGRLAALEDRYHQALRAAPEARTALSAAWAFIQEQVEAGNGPAVATALDGLERRVEAALAQPARSDAEKFGIREGIVAERRSELEAHFKTQIAAAKADTNAEIGKLTQALDEFFEESQQVVDAVRSHVVRALGSLEGELMEKLKTGNEEDLGSLTSEWLDRLNADPVIVALREAWTELGVNVEFDSTLDVLIQDVAHTLRMVPA